MRNLDQALRETFAFPAFLPGSVWLVGAGPGDLGLLTINALHAVQHADTIVYDSLINADILTLAAKDAEKIHAGKRGGKPSPKQTDITEKLVRAAKAGKRVCRLKGVDPFMFARGGEEALALAANGIAFRVISGVSSGLAGPAYAGIPASHRGINHVLLYLTGHDQCGETPSTLDWAAIARASPVLVMFMALKHLAHITERLIENGRPAGEKVAIVSNATTPQQRILTGTLSSICSQFRASNIEPPAIVMVGETVSLTQTLAWFDLQPTMLNDNSLLFAGK